MNPFCCTLSQAAGRCEQHQNRAHRVFLIRYLREQVRWSCEPASLKVGERCPDQPRTAVIAGEASPAARQGATSQPAVSCCGHTLVPEPALWWLRHLLGWLSQRCQASGSQNAFPSRDCALTAPRGCCFGKRPGFCGHGRLWWWHPPRCTWTLHSAGTHPVGNGGCCIPRAARVRSASRSLLAQTLRDRAGVCGKKEIRGSLVLSKSDIVNNGGKQLIRNVFHCVLLKSFVTCVSLLFVLRAHS